MQVPKQSHTSKLWRRSAKSKIPATQFSKPHDAIDPPVLNSLISWIAGLASPAATFCAIAILSVIAASAAEPWVRAFAEVPDLNTTGHALVIDTGRLFNQPLATAQESSSGPNNGAVATARAEPGDLGVRVFASDSGIGSGAKTGAIAEAQAQFFDNLQITSATLPLGAPMSLQFSMELDGTTSFSGNNPSTAGPPNSAVSITATVNGFSHTFREIFEINKPPKASGVQTFTVDSTVGATVTLVGLLDANVVSGFCPTRAALSRTTSIARPFSPPQVLPRFR